MLICIVSKAEIHVVRGVIIMRGGECSTQSVMKTSSSSFLDQFPPSIRDDTEKRNTNKQTQWNVLTLDKQ